MTTQSDDLNLQDSMPRRHVKHTATQIAENMQAIQFLSNLWRLVLCLHSCTGLMVLRYNFGERVLPTPVIIYNSFICVMAGALAGSPIGIAFGFGLLLMGCGHRIQVIRRNRREEKWHSTLDSTSYLEHLADRLPKKYQAYREYIPAAESGLFVIAGILLLLFAKTSRPDFMPESQFYWPQAFGVYIISIGGMMLLHASRIKKDAWNLELDRRDSQFENQAFAAMQDRDMEDVEVESMLASSGVARNAVV